MENKIKAVIPKKDFINWIRATASSFQFVETMGKDFTPKTTLIVAMDNIPDVIEIPLDGLSGLIPGAVSGNVAPQTNTEPMVPAEASN